MLSDIANVSGYPISGYDAIYVIIVVVCLRAILNQTEIMGHPAQNRYAPMQYKKKKRVMPSNVKLNKL